MKNIYISLVLPIYNEGPTLEKSINSILIELKKLKKTFEVIFVEDKSTDNSKALIESLEAKNPFIHAIYHKKNEGRGKSVKDGILASKGKICGYMDVDCEVSQKYLPIFIKDIENGSDLAIGHRFYEKSLNSIIRVIASKIYALIVKIFLKIPIYDTECGFKFFNRKKIIPIIAKTKSNGWFWDTEICAVSYYKGLNITQIPVIFSKRPDKKSTVNIIRDSVNYLLEIKKFSNNLKIHK